jgi:hypothetical protein
MRLASGVNARQNLKGRKKFCPGLISKIGERDAKVFAIFQILRWG